MFAKNKVSQSMLDAVNSVLEEGKIDEASLKIPTATGTKVLGRGSEGSEEDKEEDAKGERETGMTHAQYEKSERDKKEDKKKSMKKESAFTSKLLSVFRENKASGAQETFTDNNMGENKTLVGKQKKLDKNHNGKLDAQDLKNPKFAGKSKAERKKMALGAYYGAQKEEVELEEDDTQYKKNLGGLKAGGDAIHRNKTVKALMRGRKYFGSGKVTLPPNSKVKELDEEVELTESLIFQNETPTKHSRVTHSAFVKTHSGHLHVGDIQHGKDITGNGHDYYVSHVNGEDGGAHTEHDAKKLMHKFHKNYQKSGYKLNSKSMEEAVETSNDKNSEKITTDTLAGRIAGGKLNSFRNFKTNLTTSGTDSIPSEIEHGEDTKEKQKISTTPGPVDVKLDDKLTGPTPYTHFQKKEKVTTEEVRGVRGALKKIRGKEATEHDKEIDDFNKKVANNEEVEPINEDGWLDKYLLSKGINPQFVSQATKISHAKSGEFMAWKQSHQTESVSVPFNKPYKNTSPVTTNKSALALAKYLAKTAHERIKQDAGNEKG